MTFGKMKFFSAMMTLNTIICFSFPCAAADWEKPWSTVQGVQAAKCAQLFDAFQLQAVCMENEKRGYNKMQGTFEMPNDVAGKAKDRCASMFDTFQLQAVCMENERTGYQKMKQY